MLFSESRPPAGGHLSGVCSSRKEHSDVGEFRPEPVAAYERPPFIRPFLWRDKKGHIPTLFRVILIPAGDAPHWVVISSRPLPLRHRSVVAGVQAIYTSESECYAARLEPADDIAVPLLVKCTPHISNGLLTRLIYDWIV